MKPVSEADNFSIKLSSSYESDLGKIAKKHYKDTPRDLEALIVLLDSFYSDLEKKPDIPGTALEPWPNNDPF